MVERVVTSVIFIATVLLLAFLAFAIYDEATSEHFSLRKDRWACTASHVETTTSYTKVGDIDVPITTDHTICDQWSRK